LKKKQTEIEEAMIVLFLPFYTKNNFLSLIYV